MKNRLRLVRTVKKNGRRFLILCVILGLNLSLGLDLPHAASFGLADRVVEQKLANGLTVLMVERHQTPVVSLNMTFGVGGVNEQVGQTGLAHLYEHMAFKGTRTVGTKNYEKERPILEEWFRVGTELEQRQRELARRSQERPASSEDRAAIEGLQKRFTELQDQAGQFVAGNEMALLYQRHGGVGLNAATGKDLTRYMINLPANRLPLWAALEADRMAHPVLREFYKERGVVMEERRLRNDDSPNGLLYETFTSSRLPRTSLWHSDHRLGVGHSVAHSGRHRSLLQNLLRSRQCDDRHRGRY